MLTSVAFDLTISPDAFFVNAELTLLGAPGIVHYLVSDEKNSNKMISVYVSNIPQRDNLPKADSRSPILYNMLRAVEGMLHLQQEMIKQEKVDAIDNLLNTVLSSDHVAVIAAAVSSPDMNGFMIKEKYGVI